MGNLSLFLISLSLFISTSLSSVLLRSLSHEKVKAYDGASPIALLIVFLVLFFLGRKRRGGRALVTVFLFSTLACGVHFFSPAVLNGPLWYFLSHALSLVPVVVVWGWALERYRFKEGTLHLSIFVLAMLLAQVPFSLLKLKNETVISGILFGFQLIALILSVMGKELHFEEGEMLPPSKRMRLGVILLFFALPFAKVFPNLFFKLHMQETFSGLYEYPKALATILILKGKMTYLMAFIGVAFGFLFFLTGKRFWSLITGCALVVVGVTGILMFFPIETLGKTIYNYDHAIYGGVSSLFLFPLIQLIFFRFPKEDRFSLKLFAGLIISEAGTLIGGLSLSGIHILMGSISVGTLFYVALFLLGIASGFAGIHLLKPKDVS